MATRKQSTKPARSHFFVKELAGESPPSRAMMRRLFQRSIQFYGFELWNWMTEDQLLVVDTANQRCYCSIMGIRGEVRALHAYLGDRGIEFFRRAHAGGIQTVGDFYGAQSAVYVHFMLPDELNAQDKDLLKDVKWDYSRKFSPQFRTIRPGYHPWFPTESEALLLSECLRAAISFGEQPSRDLWTREGVYPKIQPAETGCEITTVRVSSETSPMPAMPALDKELIGTLAVSLPHSGPVLELDHFFGGGAIGRKNERKACVRVAVAIDSETAAAFRPVAQPPEANTGDMLVEAVMNAVVQTETIPRELRVGTKEHKTLLAPLASLLGCPLKLTQSMPALQFAKNHLLTMMGDPPELPGA